VLLGSWFYLGGIEGSWRLEVVVVVLVVALSDVVDWVPLVVFALCVR